MLKTSNKQKKDSFIQKLTFETTSIFDEYVVNWVKEQIYDEPFCPVNFAG